MNTAKSNQMSSGSCHLAMAREGQGRQFLAINEELPQGKTMEVMSLQEASNVFSIQIFKYQSAEY